MLGWIDIIDFQGKFYPNWKQKARTLFSTALAGEVGEYCGVITHLDGGGTNDNEYTEKMGLEEAVDTYIQLVLLVARSGFTEDDFEDMFLWKMNKLYERLASRTSKEQRT